MRYCWCYSYKYLLRYELKTECGQFLHFLTGLFMVRYDSRFGIVKLDFPIFYYDLHDGSTGRYQHDVQVMFVIR